MPKINSNWLRDKFLNNFLSSKKISQFDEIKTLIVKSGRLRLTFQTWDRLETPNLEMWKWTQLNKSLRHPKMLRPEKNTFSKSIYARKQNPKYKHLFSFRRVSSLRFRVNIVYNVEYHPSYFNTYAVGISNFK